MSAEKIQVVVRVAPLDDPKGDKDCFLPSVLLLLLLLGEALEVPRPTGGPDPLLSVVVGGGRDTGAGGGCCDGTG